MDQASSLRNPTFLSNLIHLQRAKQKRDKRGITTKVWSVTSGKGGVGKSNIVINLAVTLSRTGKKILVLDADLGLANIDILLGIHPEFDISHVISGKKSLDEVIIEGPEGIALLPGGSGLAEITELSVGQKINLMNEFDKVENIFDMMLIDTGAGISSNVLYFNVAAHDIVVVVTKELTSITDAYSLIKVVSNQYDRNRFHILINNVENKDEGVEVFRKINTVAGRFLDVELNYIGYIPYDEHIQIAVMKQKPVTILYPDIKVSQAFDAVSNNLNPEIQQAGADENVQFFWRQMLRTF